MKAEMRAQLLAVEPGSFPEKDAEGRPTGRDITYTSGLFFQTGATDTLKLSLPEGMNGSTAVGEYVLELDVRKFGREVRMKLLGVRPVRATSGAS